MDRRNWIVVADDYGDGWWAETAVETGNRKWFKRKAEAIAYAQAISEEVRTGKR